MANMWYYSEGNQQKGPIPWGALANLARDGHLRPSDLIWQEGTPDWVSAAKVPGLFNKGPARSEIGHEETDPRPRRRGPPEDYGDRIRRPGRSKQASSKGLIIGLIAGGAGLVIIAVVVIIIIVANSGGEKTAKARPGDIKVASPGPGKKTEVPGVPFGLGGDRVVIPTRDGAVVNDFLGGEKMDPARPGHHCKVFQATMVPGRGYTIELKSNDFDAFLRVENSRGMQLAANDDAPGRGTLDSLIIFNPPEADTYRIFCTSLSAGETGSFTFIIRE